MTKFSVGDKVKIISSGRTGEVIKAEYDYTNDEMNYSVIWDDMMAGVSPYIYTASIVDNGWEKANVSKEEKEDCTHRWVIYNGFREDYYYCTRCNVKKDFDS